MSKTMPAKALQPMLTLADFRNRHAGETIVVCGCGESLNDLEDPARFITIGVNDIGRLFHPNYLVVLNPPNQFAGDRFRYVEATRAEYVFTQLDDLRIPHARIVRFRLGRYGGTDFGDPNVLHHTQNSPYLAVCLAVLMGAKRIGLIGVDFTEHHFFAKTGRHVLSSKIDQINREYAALAQACKGCGIEVINLSQQSLLTAFPKGNIKDLAVHHYSDSTDDKRYIGHNGRVFFVNYHFLSCGDVFNVGLRNAAQELGLQHADAYWDDPGLPAKVQAFKPDLLFVVHGRRFVQRWRESFRSYNNAVWLLDEPYEVDDTASWSNYFDTVYVNDPSTLNRHRSAHYLPVAWDSRVHRKISGKKKYAVGFIGGYNQSREAALLKLMDYGLLSYVVGGPWKNPQLQQLCLSRNIPAEQTAALYQQTRLVVNVFRDIHHFNRKGVPAWSLNPRIYEALACGALVVSEPRPEVEQVFPELPLFNSNNELVERVQELIVDDSKFDQLLCHCQRNLSAHTYASRLKTVIFTGIGGKIGDIAGKGADLLPGWQSRRNKEMPAAITLIVEPRVTAAREMNSSASTDLILPETANGTYAATAVVARTIDMGVQGNRIIKPMLFTGMPTRNLIYHIWPVKGSIWQWNLDQLKQRIDIFNGRRIIAIVYDDKSDDPETVKEYLKGHGCEFIIEPNNNSGECITFPRMLREVSSLDPNEITFYAHGKGVKYEPNLPGPIRRWVEVQYRTCLDNWPKVVKELEQFALTGSFKRLGRYQTHQNLGDWHYCGTFFWMRHAHVFARDCLEVPGFYGGVEAWPGIYFRETEAGCLFLNTQRQAPYQPRFWQSWADHELKRWESSLERVPVPPDLAEPTPYHGYKLPRTEQKPLELDWWIQMLLQANVSNLLTIGAGAGGVAWHVSRVFREQQRHIEITVIELNPSQDLLKTLEDARIRFAQSVLLIEGDSSSESVKCQLRDHYDAVFIDSDHSYRSVRNDWLLSKGLSTRMVAFHDIVDSHWHVQNRCCVSRLWKEIKRDHQTVEQAFAEWGGIGVVKL